MSAVYRQLSQHLSDDQAVFGARSSVPTSIGSAVTSIEAAAASCVQAIRAHQPEGPCALCGYSAFGLIAFEAAWQLRAAGRAVALLALVDCQCPGVPEPLRDRIRRTVSRFIDGDARLRSALLARLLRLALRWAMWKIGKPGIGTAVTPTTAPEGAFWLARRSYVPRPYAGPIAVFSATDRPRHTKRYDVRPWRQFAAGEFEAHGVGGSHATIMAEPDVVGLATRLDRCLQDTRKP